MVHAVVEDARAAVQAGVDAIALAPRLAPWVAPAARQRHPAVLPVLVGQLPDASADLREIFAAGRVAVALVDLHAVHATSAGAALQSGIGAAASPDAPVVGQHERQVELPAPSVGIPERDSLAREHQDLPPSRPATEDATIPPTGSPQPSANAIILDGQRAAAVAAWLAQALRSSALWPTCSRRPSASSPPGSSAAEPVRQRRARRALRGWRAAHFVDVLCQPPSALADVDLPSSAARSALSAALWVTAAPAIRWVAARSGTGPDAVGMVTVTCRCSAR